MLTLYTVETDKCCFITDILATDGYDHSYHRTSFKGYLFDGKPCQPTFFPNWIRVDAPPKKIEKKTVESQNKRYELINPKWESDEVPLIIMADDSEKFESEILSLYKYKADELEKTEPVEFKVELLMRIDNFEEAENRLRKKEVKKGAYKKESEITCVNFDYQIIDKLIFPEPLRHLCTCQISSTELYKITRQHILDNIDTSIATVTLNYDSCFAVSKRVVETIPKQLTSFDFFVETRKQRVEPQKSVKNHTLLRAFEMTHDAANYADYTPLKPIIAENEKQLNEKIDEFLEMLIDFINTPLETCPHCGGIGYE